MAGLSSLESNNFQISHPLIITIITSSHPAHPHGVDTQTGEDGCQHFRHQTDYKYPDQFDVLLKDGRI